MPKRLITVATVLMIIFVFVPVIAVTNTQKDWTCLGRDAFRRSEAYSGETLALPIDISWSAQLDGKPSRTILVSKGYVVSGTENGLVSAYRLDSGERVWTNDLGGEIVSDMALTNEFICVPMDEGRVVGLDLYTGGVFWEKNEDSNILAPIPNSSQIYTVTEDGLVRAFQAANGESYWKHDLDIRPSAPPSLLMIGHYSTSNIVMPTEDDNLIVFNYTYGKQMIDWTYKLDSSMSTPAIPISESVIGVTDTGNLFCIDSRTKQLYWEDQIADSVKVNSHPAIFNSQRYVACATVDGKIHAYRIGDGFKLWTADSQDTITQPLTGVSGDLVAVTESGHVMGFKAYDGSVSFDIDLGERIITAPTYSSGYIIVATESGKLYSLASSTMSVSLSLDPEIVIIEPGKKAEVTISLNASDELVGETFYLTPRGFPCRCKINRDIQPKTTMTPGEERILMLSADSKAPSYSYDYNILCRSYKHEVPEAVKYGVILVATESDMMDLSVEQKSVEGGESLAVSFNKTEFLRSFAVKVDYNPEVLEPVSATKTMPEAHNLYWDFRTPGSALVYVSFTEGAPYKGAGQPFEILFRPIDSGTDTLTFHTIARTNNGEFVPSRDTSMDLTVQKLVQKHEVKLQINNPIAMIDGEDIQLDVAPYIKSGRTMVPLRFVGEAMGAGVEWIDDERAVVYTNTLPTGARSIKLWIGKTTALVDGVEREMDVAPEINNSRTCVGVSFVSKNFGVETGWDGETKTVTLSYEQ
jgi:outer membrane protein assembly factor BamB